MNDDGCYASLTRDQWTWEFLRRNTAYQNDYRQFIALWHALEADYSAPPHRDYPRWKLDPRAYGPLPGNDALDQPTGELCVADNDRILLECWMGAKWGFYKFPLDPQRATPPGADELALRPPPAPSVRPSPPVPSSRPRVPAPASAPAHYNQRTWRLTVTDDK